MSSRLNGTLVKGYNIIHFPSSHYPKGYKMSIIIAKKQRI